MKLFITLILFYSVRFSLSVAIRSVFTTFDKKKTHLNINEISNYDKHNYKYHGLNDQENFNNSKKRVSQSFKASNLQNMIPQKTENANAKYSTSRGFNNAFYKNKPLMTSGIYFGERSRTFKREPNKENQNLVVLGFKPPTSMNVSGELKQHSEATLTGKGKMYQKNLKNELYQKVTHRLQNLKQAVPRKPSDLTQDHQQTPKVQNKQRSTTVQLPKQTNKRGPTRINKLEMKKSQETLIMKSKRKASKSVKSITQPMQKEKTALGVYPTGEHESDDTSIADALFKTVRVLCYVLTQPVNHNRTLFPIKETWGKRCNKLLFLSTVEDPRVPTIKLNVTGSVYHQTWQKVKAAYLFVYDRYRNDYDWFLRADDDAFVIVENLRYMLAWFNPKELIYFGCRFKSFGAALDKVVDGQGPGIVLSQGALRAVAAGLKGKLCNRFKFTDRFGEELGICLTRIGVKPLPTRDALGSHRFLPAAPEEHVSPIKSNSHFWYWMDEYYPVSQGLSCCSDYAVIFHNITPVNMYGLEYLIYRVRPFGIKFSNAKLSYRKHNVSVRGPHNTIKPSHLKKAMVTKVQDDGEDYNDEINGIGPSDKYKVSVYKTELHSSVKPYLKYERALDKIYEVGARYKNSKTRNANSTYEESKARIRNNH